MTKRSSFLLLFIALLALCVWSYREFQTARPGIDVSICLPKSPASGLPVIAQEHGFFQEQGLNVDLQISNLGKDCVDRLVTKKVNFTASNIPPIVSALTEGHPLMVVTELTTSTRNTSLIYFKNHKTPTGDQFGGKKVGLVKGTNSETFLRLYLKAHDRDAADLNIVQASSLDELGNFLKDGTVEAAVMWEPFLSKYLKTLPQNSFIAQDSPFYSQFCVLASTSEYINTNPELVQKFILALEKARDYADDHRSEARHTVMAQLKYSEEELPPAVWSKFRMDLGLSAVLISMMQESQKPLLPPRNPADEAPELNVFQALYPQALRQIGKDLVTYE